MLGEFWGGLKIKNIDTRKKSVVFVTRRERNQVSTLSLSLPVSSLLIVAKIYHTSVSPEI